MKEYLSMRLIKKPQLECSSPFFGDQVLNLVLPDGCSGILYVWKSKKAARAFYGNNVACVEIQENEK